MKDQMTALAKEYQSYKTTSEKTVADLNASLVKVKEEHAQHLKECKLAAEKATKSIADLEASNKQLKEEMKALAQEYQAYKVASEKTVADLEIRQKKNAKSIELLESQGKKDAESASKAMAELTVSNKRVSVLEGQLKSDAESLSYLKGQHTEALALAGKEKVTDYFLLSLLASVLSNTPTLNLLVDNIIDPRTLLRINSLLLIHPLDKITNHR